jgi:nicotinate-nucleotide adenylyltransferase
MTPVGIFGGTFDPIHYGHLRTAFELMQVLQCGEIRFVPSRRPPHRDITAAEPELRLKMVEAAIAGQGGFVLDDREFQREGPSFTVDTLTSLREELGNTPGHAADRGSAFRALRSRAHPCSYPVGDRIAGNPRADCRGP